MKVTLEEQVARLYTYVSMFDDFHNRVTKHIEICEEREKLWCGGVLSH